MKKLVHVSVQRPVQGIIVFTLKGTDAEKDPTYSGAFKNTHALVSLVPNTEEGTYYEYAVYAQWYECTGLVSKQIEKGYCIVPEFDSVLDSITVPEPVKENSSTFYDAIEELKDRVEILEEFKDNKPELLSSVSGSFNCTDDAPVLTLKSVKDTGEEVSQSVDMSCLSEMMDSKLESIPQPDLSAFATHTEVNAVEDKADTALQDISRIDGTVENIQESIAEIGGEVNAALQSVEGSFSCGGMEIVLGEPIALSASADAGSYGAGTVKGYLSDDSTPYQNIPAWTLEDDYSATGSVSDVANTLITASASIKASSFGETGKDYYFYGADTLGGNQTKFLSDILDESKQVFLYTWRTTTYAPTPDFSSPYKALLTGKDNKDGTITIYFKFYKTTEQNIPARLTLTSTQTNGVTSEQIIDMSCLSDILTQDDDITDITHYYESLTSYNQLKLLGVIQSKYTNSSVPTVQYPLLYPNVPVTFNVTLSSTYPASHYLDINFSGYSTERQTYNDMSFSSKLYLQSISSIGSVFTLNLPSIPETIGNRVRLTIKPVSGTNKYIITFLWNVSTLGITDSQLILKYTTKQGTVVTSTASLLPLLGIIQQRLNQLPQPSLANSYTDGLMGHTQYNQLSELATSINTLSSRITSLENRIAALEGAE